MNKITLSLAFAVFGIITTEFGVIGMLPEIAASFKIAADDAGLLVSLFALTVAVFGPVVTLFATRFDRKTVVLTGILAFIVSNFLSYAATTFEVLLVARILPAFFLPALFSNGVVMAMESVAEEKAIKAVATIYMGLSIATVVGIPSAAFLSGIASWKTVFLVIGVVNTLALFGIFYIVPGHRSDQRPKADYKLQLGVLRKNVLWIHMGVVFLISSGAFSVYSYFADYLKNVFGLTASDLSFMLVLFGTTGIVGNWAAGIAFDKDIVKSMIGYILSMVIIFLALYQPVPNLQFQVVIIGIWGFFHMAGFLAGQVWINISAPEAPELANSLVVSIANLGIAAGAFLGGTVIANFGLQQIVFSGIGGFVLALAIVLGSGSHLKNWKNSTR